MVKQRKNKIPKFRFIKLILYIFEEENRTQTLNKPVYGGKKPRRFKKFFFKMYCFETFMPWILVYFDPAVF